MAAPVRCADPSEDSWNAPASPSFMVKVLPEMVKPVTVGVESLPAGGAIALPITYSQFLSWGFTPGAVTAGLLTAGVWDQLARQALPVLAVAVIEVQKPSEKIPPIEQTYSAGAVCLALLNAALAAGWGANWLSGWASHDATFAQQGLGLSADERIAGLIHIGTETSAPPERPRPNIKDITTWL